MAKKKQELRVIDATTREVVKTISVEGKGSRQVEKVMLGLLRNMSDEYLVDDSDAYPSEAK